MLTSLEMMKKNIVKMAQKAMKLEKRRIKIHYNKTMKIRQNKDEKKSF